MSPVATMKALLESGVHFGHRTNKWDPRMRKYIFTERNGIHIIDLQQTAKLLDDAYNFIRDKAAAGGVVLFVGTKRQAQDTIREQAERCGMPYVTERWLGGTITNWATIQKRIFELERLERMRDSGEINLLTKKEGLMIEREISRLELRLSGLRAMKRLPDVLFVVDVHREVTAVHEANLKEIPVVAMVDTNCNPSKIDYVIPSNDDAIRAIKLLVGRMADAVMEGRTIRGKESDEEEMLDAAMPSEVTRFMQDDDELEDEVLLGESTLKHLGSSKKAVSVEDEDEGVEEDDLVVEEVEDLEAEAESDEEEGEVEEAAAEVAAEPKVDEAAADEEDEEVVAEPEADSDEDEDEAAPDEEDEVEEAAAKAATEQEEAEAVPNEIEDEAADDEEDEEEIEAEPKADSDQDAVEDEAGDTEEN